MTLFRAQVFLWTLRALFWCSRCSAMHATNVERNSWRLPPDDTVQVADQRSKSAEVSLISDCTCSSNSETGMATTQPVTGHDPTAVPPVLYSYNALPWVLEPTFLSLTSPEGSPLKFRLSPVSSNVPVRTSSVRFRCQCLTNRNVTGVRRRILWNKRKIRNTTTIFPLGKSQKWKRRQTLLWWRDFVTSQVVIYRRN